MIKGSSRYGGHCAVCSRHSGGAAAAAFAEEDREEEDGQSTITRSSSLVSGSLPFASWQDDMSRRLGGVMRKLHF